MPEINYKKRDREVSRYIHKLFWRAAARNKFPFLLAVTCFAPAFAILMLYIPYQIAYTIKFIFEKNYDQVVAHSIYIGLSTIALVALTSIAVYGMNRLNFEHLLSNVYKNFLSKDYQFYTDTYVGALGSQIGQLRDAFTQYTGIMIIQISKNAVVIGGGLLIIAFQAPVLAFIAIATMVLILGYLFITGKYRLKYRQIVSQSANDLTGKMTDSLSQGLAIKAQASESYEVATMARPIREFEQLQTKSWDLYIPTSNGRHILNSIALIALLLTTAKLYINDQISLVIVVLVQFYMIRIINATQDVYEQLKQYEQAMGMAYEPAKTMLVQSKVRDPEAPNTISDKPKTINLNNVSYSYHDEPPVYVLKDYGLMIKSGQKIGLVGYSGSGKTTLTKLMLRFMDVSLGSIEIDGVDIRDIKQKDLRDLISYVPQEPLLFHRSIYANIAYGRPNAKKAEIIKAAKLAYVDEFANELPDGLETIVGERGIKLSGGQRQRVAIARTILKDSPILILDEATSALDSKSEKLIQDALWRLMKDRTALVIAHRLSTVQRMDKIIVMDKGKIVQQGNHKELLKEKGIYRELWEHQSGGYLGGVSNEN